jgi:hypothetical protein
MEELEAELVGKSWTGRGEKQTGMWSLPDGNGKGKWNRRAKHWEQRQSDQSRAGLDAARVLWAKGELARWTRQEANWEKSGQSRAGLDTVDRHTC